MESKVVGSAFRRRDVPARGTPHPYGGRAADGCAEGIAPYGAGRRADVGIGPYGEEKK